MPSVELELQRKTIHLIGLGVPIIYWLTSRWITLLIVGVFLLGFAAFELYRWRHGIPLKEAKDFVNPVMRPSERNGLGAHVYFTAGIFVVLFLYSIVTPALGALSYGIGGNIAIVAILMLVLGDGAAALVGMKLGKTRITWNRTLEGSLALFVVAFSVALLVVSPWVAVSGAIAAACAEYIPINDNLSIPILAGFAMALVACFL